MIIRLTLTAILIFLLSGCAGVGWKHTTETSEKYHQDVFECEMIALNRFPVRMVTETISVGYRTPVKTDCQKSDLHTSCTSTGGEYIPGSTSTKDVNQSNRGRSQDNCLRSRGYKYQSFPNWLGGGQG